VTVLCVPDVEQDSHIQLGKLLLALRDVHCRPREDCPFPHELALALDVANVFNDKVSAVLVRVVNGSVSHSG